MTVTLIKYPAPLLNKIGSYVCQAVIYIQQQQPELLLDKYRSISWRDNNNQSRLKAKLIELISNVPDWESLINRVEEFVHTLLVSDSTNTPVLIKLQEKIRHLEPKSLEKKASAEQKDLPIESEKKSDKTIQDINSSKSPQDENLSIISEQKNNENQQNINTVNIAVEEQVENPQQNIIKTTTALLLDIENTQLTPEAEEFLAGFCSSPIQIRIAFANWQNMGHKDTEFDNRGYHLIHIPCGQDSPDGKITTFASRINECYPTVKEVLLCSSDNVMNNLCKPLQEKGLTVYQVSQKYSNLTILNGQTDETENHTILPSIEKLLSQIKEIIEEQEKQTSNQWIKLSKICKLFKEKYNFGINKVVSHHLPGKNVKNIFVNQSDFVIHQISEHPEVYVTLFKMPAQQNADSEEYQANSEQ